MSDSQLDTIVAIATAHGAGGVGIVRVSGPAAKAIAQGLGIAALVPRQARHAGFRDAGGDLIDDGIALFFPGPRSYTGDDVLELQAHGSPVLLALLLRRCISLGARQARPGEFTERAFLAGKLDLAQAEAVADLISAGSETAARAARRSLEGVFSARVDALVEQLTQLRMYVEAALDFPDEDIDFLAAPELDQRLRSTSSKLGELLRGAQQGKRLVDGLHAVIVGEPNVGKSSLLNALAAEDRAIVSDLPGTTRDLLREQLNLDGVALTLVDTAGFREAPDPVEAEGMRRARGELERADVVLAMLGPWSTGQSATLDGVLPAGIRVLWIHGKVDLLALPARMEQHDDGAHLWLSAHTGVGLDLLRDWLSELAGGSDAGSGSFSARARHVQALQATAGHLEFAQIELARGSAELAADHLRQAQRELGQITGHLDTEGLLGRIFSGFCIGK